MKKIQQTSYFQSLHLLQRAVDPKEKEHLFKYIIPIKNQEMNIEAKKGINREMSINPQVDLGASDDENGDDDEKGSDVVPAGIAIDKLNFIPREQIEVVR